MYLKQICPILLPVRPAVKQPLVSSCWTSAEFIAWRGRGNNTATEVNVRQSLNNRTREEKKGEDEGMKRRRRKGTGVYGGEGSFGRAKSSLGWWRREADSGASLLSCR